MTIQKRLLESATYTFKSFYYSYGRSSVRFTCTVGDKEIYVSFGTNTSQKNISTEFYNNIEGNTYYNLYRVKDGVRKTDKYSSFDLIIDKVNPFGLMKEYRDEFIDTIIRTTKSKMSSRLSRGYFVDDFSFFGSLTFSNHISDELKEEIGAVYDTFKTFDEAFSVSAILKYVKQFLKKILFECYDALAKNALACKEDKYLLVEREIVNNGSLY